MSIHFDGLPEFEKLHKSFARDRNTAEQLISLNPKDSLEIRIAIVGFSYNAATDQWARSHFDFVQKQIRMTSSEGNELLFFSLCHGFLLGLLQAGKINDLEFDLAEAQLPGFLLLKGGNSDYERPLVFMTDQLLPQNPCRLTKNIPLTINRLQKLSQDSLLLRLH
jgi:hypothetical protein